MKMNALKEMIKLTEKYNKQIRRPGTKHSFDLSDLEEKNKYLGCK